MVRRYYYITFTDFIYVRIQVLLWAEVGLMYSTNLSKGAGDLVGEIYDSIESNKPIVVDCKGIDGLIDHSWDSIFKSMSERKRQIIFINYSPILEKIENSVKEFCNNIRIERDTYFYNAFYGSKTLEYSDATYRLILDKLQHIIDTYILSSFCMHNGGEMKVLPSTPFKANGEYNANSIVSDPEKFIWTSILFSDFISEKIGEEKIGSSLLQLKFLSVSLRSSPIAASVALLLNKQLMTIEHLGPMRKYFNSSLSPKIEHYEYVYLGDFSFAGTEIRMTKMYASLTGSKLDHVFVLGSLFSKERFEDFKLHAMSDLHAINPNAKYQLF